MLLCTQNIPNPSVKPSTGLPVGLALQNCSSCCWMRVVALQPQLEQPGLLLATDAAPVCANRSWEPGCPKPPVWNQSPNLQIHGVSLLRKRARTVLGKQYILCFFLIKWLARRRTASTRQPARLKQNHLKNQPTRQQAITSFPRSEAGPLAWNPRPSCSTSQRAERCWGHEGLQNLPLAATFGFLIQPDLGFVLDSHKLLLEANPPAAVCRRRFVPGSGSCFNQLAQGRRMGRGGGAASSAERSAPDLRPTQRSARCDAGWTMLLQKPHVSSECKWSL